MVFKQKMLSAKLISDYNTVLMANGKVRALMASVVQDPQNETVNMSASKATVTAADKLNQENGDGGAARREIIGWLNTLYFTLVSSKKKKEIFPLEWWWEMHTRIQKLLIVSMVLEGNNLRSFGCVPKKSDIPQCLVKLQSTLEQKRKNFHSLKLQFLECVETLDSNYITLYL